MVTDESGEWFGVRCVFRWKHAGEEPYEERITLWRAADLDEALALAEADAHEYADRAGIDYLGLAQGYASGERELTPGSEVFSLLRDSALAPDEYLDRHFCTGGEHQDHS